MKLAKRLVNTKNELNEIYAITSIHSSGLLCPFQAEHSIAPAALSLFFDAAVIFGA